MKRKAAQMQSMQEEQQNARNNSVHQQPKANTSPEKADYIEFEEIKS